MGRISELMLVRKVEDKHSDTGGLPSFSPTRWRTATNRRSRRVAVDWGASSCIRSVHLPRSLLRPIVVRFADTRVPAWPACVYSYICTYGEGVQTSSENGRCTRTITAPRRSARRSRISQLFLCITTVRLCCSECPEWTSWSFCFVRFLRFSHD